MVQIAVLEYEEQQELKGVKDVSALFLALQG